ncbi:MAG TPA: DUF3313 domain-containing protein [Candidatus Binataceae bacterium]|nr:DUF3313 domain-containing protein [Candidatus Binataceae bacterium]
MQKFALAKTTLAAAVALASGIALASLLTGCSQTVSSKSAVAQEMEGGTLPPAAAQFFGNNASLLHPGKEGQAALVYINPNVQWSNYTKIMLQPVQYWDNTDSPVPSADEQKLITYFHNQLHEVLQKNFTMVDQPGPGVLVLYVALINATTATPVLRSISVVIPQARLLNGLQSLATGSYAFVGSAEAEMKAMDGSTGEFLAGAVDQRSGGVALSTAAQWQWGDAENAMNYWSDRISTRLLELQGRSPAPAQSAY